ncbi:MAG: bifunctional diaminohydroxyphosphoribosylaminopyrimidine deaminase/5-amino-6-(5-phosphoribosylamino)uracil reductase RibD [Candidatus Melainabacteria bacterium]
MKAPGKTFSSVDEYYIDQCLQLAKLGEGLVSPNPMVGAVVLDKDGRRVAEGYHQRAGGPHAEVLALDQAGERARGGTLYVNLEPCNHHGKTPPCTQAIIAAGIERVICGTLDPNPEVSGAGRDELQNARISVRYGFLEEACLRLNESFFHYITTRHPFVTLKLGLTMDGKIAARNGSSQWITGPLARQFVHHLRNRYDAILTTAETVIADDPALTVRDVPMLRDPEDGRRKQPTRVILDRQCRLSFNHYQVFDTHQAPTWVFVSGLRATPEYLAMARGRNVRITEVDDTGLGLNMKEVLYHLGQGGITSVMVEAGGRLAGHLLSMGLANKVYLFYGPQVLSDPMARGAFSNAVNLQLPQAPRLHFAHTRRLNKDLLVEAYPDKRTTALMKTL